MGPVMGPDNTIAEVFNVITSVICVCVRWCLLTFTVYIVLCMMIPLIYLYIFDLKSQKEIGLLHFFCVC